MRSLRNFFRLSRFPQRVFACLVVVSSFTAPPASAEGLEGTWNFNAFSTELEFLNNSGNGPLTSNYDYIPRSGTITITREGVDTYGYSETSAGGGTDMGSGLVLPRYGDVFELQETEQDGNDSLFRGANRFLLVGENFVLSIYHGVSANQTFSPKDQIFYGESEPSLWSKSTLPTPDSAQWAGTYDVSWQRSTWTSLQTTSAGGQFKGSATITGAGSSYSIAYTESGSAEITTSLTASSNRLTGITKTAASNPYRLNPASEIADVSAREFYERTTVLQLGDGRLVLCRSQFVVGTYFGYQILYQQITSVGVASPTTRTVPVITRQPVDTAVLEGANAFLTVTATGQPAPSYLWSRSFDDGVTWNPVPVGYGYEGITASTLVVIQSPATPFVEALYRVTVANSEGSVTSQPANIKLLLTPTTRLPNLSVRTSLAAGQNLIVGFVTTGGSKNILLRAVGPGLERLDVPDRMADPGITLFNSSGVKVDENDDWTSASGDYFAELGAFALTPGSKDAALVLALDGLATAHVSGRSGSRGIVLVEGYDIGTSNDQRLINVSARNYVGTGDDVLIAGFFVQGADPKTLLIRAVGPKLRDLDVEGTLVDPVLTLYDTEQNVVASNDNWDAALSPAFAATYAFPLDEGSLDAAMIVTLLPGGYTVHVSGAGDTTGEALVEIYELP